MLAIPHIGVDEAGRGCLAGPVVAGAVIFPQDLQVERALPGLDDSKKLSEKKRNQLAPLIRQYALGYGLGLAWAAEIDGINIVNATMRAMSRALVHLAQRSSLSSPWPALYVDGSLPLRETEWLTVTSRALPGQHCEYFPTELFPLRQHRLATLTSPARPIPFPFTTNIAVVDGDSLIPAIAAASILAKTYRDALMVRLDARCPGFGLARHKGYGTKAHTQAITTIGTTCLHRKTFLRGLIPASTQLSLL